MARRRAVEVARLSADGHVVVTVDVADPGNLGTIIRSAEASGADGVVVTGPASVDLHHPKVVRASAGAIFGVPVAEDPDAASALDEVGRRERRRLAARATDADAYDEVDLAAPARWSSATRLVGCRTGSTRTSTAPSRSRWPAPRTR